MGILSKFTQLPPCIEEKGQRENRETGIMVQIAEDRLKYHGVKTVKELQVRQVRNKGH